MDDETPTTELPTLPVPASPQPAHRPRWRRALAIAAGVAMVPALYAVATAATGGGDSSPSTAAVAREGVDDQGTETEIEHGVAVEKPHGGATTPSVPEVTSPTTPSSSTPATPTTPDVTTPTTPDVTTPTTPEPGDDNGNGGNGGGAVTPVPSGTQSFSSVGGSIVVEVNGASLSLVSSSPAVGFGAEVHDNGPSRVEVRFTDGDNEWRIRIELGARGLTSEITQHG